MNIGGAFQNNIRLPQLLRFTYPLGAQVISLSPILSPLMPIIRTAMQGQQCVPSDTASQAFNATVVPARNTTPWAEPAGTRNVA